MKNLINRILKAFNIGGRDWAVLLLALLLAFSIWVIHNLSLKYNDYLTVSVSARCHIDGHAALASNTCDVVARGRATGYKVLKFNMPRRKQGVTLDFPSSAMKHKEGDLYYVTSDALQEYTHLMYGTGVSIEYFVTDTLFYRFPVVNCIKVPVQPVTSLTYDSQYMSSGQISLSPDSVYVYGEPHRLEAISQVNTKPIRYSALNSNVSGIVDLENVRGVTFSDTQVSYALDVVRYVEMSSVAQVRCVNLPPDKVLMCFPSNVNVTLKCAYPLPVNFDNRPSVYVDYNDFVRSISGKCKVNVMIKGTGIIEADVEPAYVECMLVEK